MELRIHIPGIHLPPRARKVIELEEWEEVFVFLGHDKEGEHAVLHWPTYDTMYIQGKDLGEIWFSGDQGKSWRRVDNNFWERQVTFRWRIRYIWWGQSRWYRMYVRAQYILTGHCGLGCGVDVKQEEVVDDEYTISWNSQSFVPEAGCPVHDKEFVW